MDAENRRTAWGFLEFMYNKIDIIIARVRSKRGSVAWEISLEVCVSMIEVRYVVL